MFSKKQVNYIADLSRIKISSKETELFQKEFSEILDYFDLLKKADLTENSSFDCQKNKLREDEIIKFPGDLLKLVPEKDGNHIKVKKIL